MKNAFKKIWNAITTVVVILVVILALLLVGVRIIGFQVFTVLSGSMEPAYKTGSLIYVKDVDPMTLTDGDVITFMLDEDTVATHRIVGVVPDEEDPSTIRFRTKGDANDFEDGQLVHYKNVIGSPVFTIPGLGYVANYIQHPPGLYFSIAAAVVILLLAFLPDLLDDDKPKKKKKHPDPEPEELPRPKRKAAPKKASPVQGEESHHKKASPVQGEESHHKKASPVQGEVPRRGGGVVTNPEKKPAPAPKRPAPPKSDMDFDLEDILAEFRND